VTLNPNNETELHGIALFLLCDELTGSHRYRPVGLDVLGTGRVKVTVRVGVTPVRRYSDALSSVARIASAAMRPHNTQTDSVSALYFSVLFYVLVKPPHKRFDFISSKELNIRLLNLTVTTSNRPRKSAKHTMIIWAYMRAT